MSAAMSALFSDPIKLAAAIDVIDVIMLMIVGTIILFFIGLIIAIYFYRRAKAKAKKIPAYLRTY